MSGPKRETAAGRTYLELRKKAKAEGRTTAELLQLSALEAFVDRLAGSTHANNLVLKGGVLLAAYDTRRPTKDVDFSAHNIANDLHSVSAVVNEVLRVARDDGWTFGVTRAEVIREDAGATSPISCFCRRGLSSMAQSSQARWSAWRRTEVCRCEP